MFSIDKEVGSLKRIDECVESLTKMVPGASVVMKGNYATIVNLPNGGSIMFYISPEP